MKNQSIIFTLLFTLLACKDKKHN